MQNNNFQFNTPIVSQLFQNQIKAIKRMTMPNGLLLCGDFSKLNTRVCPT
jgi:hypothetical protein